MASTKATRAPAGDDRRSPRKVVLAGGLDGQSNKPKITEPQALRADLIGSNTCSANGITAHGAAPVLILCRQLLAAGLDPDQALHVFRGATLALRVRSIGEAAGLEIGGDGTSFRPRREPDAAPPMRKSGCALVEDRPAHFSASTDGGDR